MMWTTGLSWYIRADSTLAPSQWETSLQSNGISHWLGANLESALYVSHKTSWMVLSLWKYNTVCVIPQDLTSSCHKSVWSVCNDCKLPHQYALWLGFLSHFIKVLLFSILDPMKIYIISEYKIKHCMSLSYNGRWYELKRQRHNSSFRLNWVDPRHFLYFPQEV